MIQNLHSDIAVWLGQRFLGTGLRNVGAAMIVITIILFYTTGVYNRIVSRKENMGY